MSSFFKQEESEAAHKMPYLQISLDVFAIRSMIDQEVT
jgi:hypothetical protein